MLVVIFLSLFVWHRFYLQSYLFNIPKVSVLRLTTLPTSKFSPTHVFFGFLENQNPSCLNLLSFHQNPLSQVCWHKIFHQCAFFFFFFFCVLFVFICYFVFFFSFLYLIFSFLLIFSFYFFSSIFFFNFFVIFSFLLKSLFFYVLLFFFTLTFFLFFFFNYLFIS